MAFAQMVSRHTRVMRYLGARTALVIDSHLQIELRIQKFESLYAVAGTLLYVFSKHQAGKIFTTENEKEGEGGEPQKRNQQFLTPWPY